METRCEALHFVSVGHVMRYPPEGISIIEATHRSLMDELRLRLDLETYYKALWQRWIQAGTGKACAGSDSEPGVSLWIRRGVVPAFSDWPDIAALSREPDFKISIPPASTEANLSKMADDVLAAVKTKDASRTIRPFARSDMKASIRNLSA